MSDHEINSTELGDNYTEFIYVSDISKSSGFFSYFMF